MEHLNSGRVLPATLPFSEAVRHGDTLHLSGQVGIVPGTMKLVEGGIREETRQALQNIKTCLEAQGLSMADIVKCTVMLADISGDTWSEDITPAPKVLGRSETADIRLDHSSVSRQHCRFWFD